MFLVSLLFVAVQRSIPTHIFVVELLYNSGAAFVVTFYIVCLIANESLLCKDHTYFCMWLYLCLYLQSAEPS